MKKIKTWKNKIINRFVGLDDLLEIRTDFLELYQVALSHPHYRTWINPDSTIWYSKAIEAGTHSEYYDPHKKIISIINLLTVLLGVILGIIGYLALHISIVGLLITITPISALKIYSKLLSLDTELIASTNKKLKLNIGTLLKLKRRRNNEIVVAYIWNQSLNNTKTIPILLLLRLIRCINGHIYKIIISALKKFSVIYAGDKNKKRLFRKLWESRKKFR